MQFHDMTARESVGEVTLPKAATTGSRNHALAGERIRLNAASATMTQHSTPVCSPVVSLAVPLAH